MRERAQALYAHHPRGPAAAERTRDRQASEGHRLRPPDGSEEEPGLEDHRLQPRRRPLHGRGARVSAASRVPDTIIVERSPGETRTALLVGEELLSVVH